MLLAGHHFYNLMYSLKINKITFSGMLIAHKMCSSHKKQDDTMRKP